MYAIIGNSLIISLLILSVFWKVGDFPIDQMNQIIDNWQGDPSNPKDLEDLASLVIVPYGTYVANIRGVAFMISNQLSFSASINVILQIPMQAPVMRRELANKMYSPTAYFLGRFLSNMILQFFYPLITIFVLFWGIGIDTSALNFGWMMGFGVLSNVVFCGQGYFLGIAVDDEDRVKLVNMFVILIFSTCNGILANLETVNPLIKFFSWISPSRFSVEGFFRRVID